MSYRELLVLKHQAYLGFKSIDLPSVEAQIDRHERAASRFVMCMANVAHWDAGNRIGYVDEFNRDRCLANAIGFASI